MGQALGYEDCAGPEAARERYVKTVRFAIIMHAQLGLRKRATAFFLLLRKDRDVAGNINVQLYMPEGRPARTAFTLLDMSVVLAIHGENLTVFYKPLGKKIGAKNVESSAKPRNMSNKRRVFVSIYHRGLLSLGENRQQLGYAAYHWGILISPKVYKEQNCYTFDVSDAARPDPETRVDHNPNHEWVFRSNPTVSGSVVCLIMIGKLPNGVEISEIRTCLQSIPVPQKNATPEQNCVTWAMAAVKALQENGYAEQFKINQFMDAGIEFADATLADKSGTPATVARMNYTTRKIRTCLLGARARVIAAGTISTVPAQLLALPADAAVVLALLGEHTLGWHSG
ncbi:hypothetical protein V492_03923 [Pseudogymnoascus sp. VKM F-4246]|nr:hypothetical protein V492_03923 [Pseudogymnoascus sp. VKM F-4246]